MNKLLEALFKLASAEVIRKLIQWVKKRTRSKEVTDAAEKCAKTGDCSDFNNSSGEVRKQ